MTTRAPCLIGAKALYPDFKLDGRLWKKLDRLPCPMVSLPGPFVCRACRVSWSHTRPTQAWHQLRTAASLQSKRPSRMILSRDVAKTSSTPPRGTRTPKKNAPSVFGGLNRTQTNIGPDQRTKVGRRVFKGNTNVQSKSKAKPSGEAFKALKMQRALAPISYSKRAETKESMAPKESFSSFPLLPIVQDSIAPQVLNGRADIAPSPIQRLAIPALLGANKSSRSQPPASFKQYLLAAETGSGKTLAYLLPVIDALKRADLLEKRNEEAASAEPTEDSPFVFQLAPPKQDKPDSATGRPKAIILVPTAELVEQVGAVVKSLSHTVKYRSAILSSNYSGQIIRNRLFNPRGIDMIISTPHLLASIVESDPNVVARVTHFVIDEADSLLDRSFSPLIKTILDRATPSLKQLVFCSATIPRKLDSYLEKHYPDVVRLTTPNLHAIPRRVQLSVVDVEGQPYRGNRNLACADTIWNLGKEAISEGEVPSDRVLRLIVFVNERETTEEVATFLRSKGLEASALNRDAGTRHTSDILSEFTGTVAAHKAKEAGLNSTASETGASRDGRQPNVKVLVMTDIGSRGIDTLEVRNVILYDVPHTSIDFIHRLGRVGRMGRRGRGFVLVGKGDRKDIVKEVRTGMFMGKALI